MKRCLLVLVCLFVSVHSFAQTLEADRLALVAIYNQANGSDWVVNWVVPGNTGDSPCGWMGVTCEGGRVTKLVLRERIQESPLPSAIGGLTALNHLDLAGGGEELPSIVGALPIELGSLTNLEYLDLSSNPISGENIAIIGNLTNLKHLAISPYYWQMPAEWSSLVNLEYLSLSLGPIMHSGGAAGNIPGYFGNFTKLKTLIMSNASWTGTIPASLGNLTNLEVLEMEHNKLTGPIPASFNNLTKLTKLDLSYNNLTGPIPNILGIPASADVRINNNAFNFSGMETNITRLDAYGSQKKFKMRVDVALGGQAIAGLSAPDAGGTEANNTYKWYKGGTLLSTTNGVSYIVASIGVFRVEVTNSLVPGLTMVSEDEAVVAMPVSLISFEGKSENNQTKLTWKTASETNNKGFEIERSADARTFETIGFVDGSGDTKESQFYHFTDLDPLATGYYRLKQLDYDGKFEYSQVIVVRAENRVVKIYPNPAQRELTVEGAEGNVAVSVFTPAGGPVITGAKLSGGKLDVTGLNEGIYTLKIGDTAKKLLIKR